MLSAPLCAIFPGAPLERTYATGQKQTNTKHKLQNDMQVLPVPAVGQNTRERSRNN